MLYRYLNAAQVAGQFYDNADNRILESTKPSDISAIPDLDVAALRANEQIPHTREMVILTMSQQLYMLTDQREKGIVLQEMLRPETR